MIILLEGEDPEALATAAEKFHATLTKHSNVKSVTYRPKARGPLPADYGPRLTREAMTQKLKDVREKMKSGLIDVALKEDPLGIREDLAKEARKRFSGFRFDLSDGILYSPDRRALLVIVAGHKNPHDLEAAKSTYDLAASVSVPVRVSMTGGYAVAVEMQKEIRSDFLNTGVISIIGVTLMFLLGFRELRAIPFAAIPIAVGTILTLGLTQMIYERLTPITIVFAPMLVGLGYRFPDPFLQPVARGRGYSIGARRIRPLRSDGGAHHLRSSLLFGALSIDRYRELGVIAGAESS